jgi:transcription-repair coupling factor (superfamily II helicase)
VLMSTNIVESGLDIPNANTIIIHDAQNFGLSDLHQLRGRVGRSNRKAFCYLITPPLSTLTQEARKRLTTIEEFSELGGGFQVAMRDMDIRGAGDILGGEQSGFISEIGYDTYHKILDEAIRELKETDFKDLFKDEITREENFVRDCTIDTDVEMHIPDEYVSSVAERLILYRELDELGDEAAIEKYRQRLTDRFGPVPVQVHELFDGIRLRKLAKQLGFEKIVQRRGIVKCFFLENQDSAFYQTETFTRIIGYIQHHPNKCALKQTEKNLILTLQSVRSLSEAIQLLERIIAFESVTPE